ncbi:rRNA methyltransferase 1, mitochondrial-like isoform X1 [Centruroides sculpturatus]|uniref:rRNA methyltransferase 1, mitochondrial-like isoform X1 n=1 Tax=Centruroides sculpturatus TaxID=218467 RepID=UPI000C6E3ACA|nr:rRNA methyltransferase 1, mitochondrial-like isoform X1 [Centruroides sculpturatus]
MFSNQMRSVFVVKNMRNTLKTKNQCFINAKYSYETNKENIDDEKLKTVRNRPSYISEDLLEHEKYINRPKSLTTKKISKVDIKGEIIYGLHPVQLALQCGRRAIHQLYVQDRFRDSDATIRKKIIELARDLKIPVKEVQKPILQQISKNHVHQGVCLDVSVLHTEDIDKSAIEDTVTENKMTPIWLILDCIQDPMNFGAVLRSSYYFGIDKVCVVKGNSCKLSPVVSKASSGALEVIPVYSINNLPEFLQEKKDSNWYIIGTASYSDNICSKCIGIHTLKLNKPTIFILGNEGVGMSECVYDLCDNIVTILPSAHLHPGIDSLNVSVVCGKQCCVIL